MPILELNGISKKFGALVVAEEISFAVESGEALGIIGPNGAGKSTLFNLISGNVAADSGTIRFSDQDVTRVPPMQRCFAGMGRTFQIPQPFEQLTVFENLLVAGAFGARQSEGEVANRCAEILIDTGLIDRATLDGNSRIPEPADHLIERHSGDKAEIRAAGHRVAGARQERHAIGPVQVELLVAEMDRHTAVAEHLLAHAKPAAIKIHGFIDVAGGQHQMVQRADHCISASARLTLSSIDMRFKWSLIRGNLSISTPSRASATW